MADLEVGDFRLVAGVGEDLEAHFNKLVHAAHEHILLAEQIGLGLLGEGGLDGACAQSAQSLGVSQAQRPGLAIRILLHSHDDRNATAGGVLTTNDVARALRGDHEHRMILGRLDVAVVDVEAVSESNSCARLDVRLDVIGPDGALVLIRSQNHDDIGLSSSFRNGLDFQTLLLGVLDGLGGRTQANDDVHTGIAQVQRMSVTLGTVTDDGNLLTFEDREIAVVLVPDLCSHCTWHSFLCSGVNASRRSGFYHSQMNSRVFVHGFCPANWGLSYSRPFLNKH